MRNAFLKDIFRDLNKSASRFGGMFAVVALGVFVFCGLGSAGALMGDIGNSYFDKSRFFDIHVVSTYGLNQKDIDAIAAMDGVASVTGGYNMDALIVQGQHSLNTKIHSVEIGETALRQVNQPEILSGRFPERENEVLVEQAVLTGLGLEVGDTITLQSGRAADIRTQLRRNQFRIVGTASSPLYFSIMRGASSVGSGEADVFILIPAENFRQTVYSEVYVQVSGAEGLYAYGPEYEELVQSVIKKIELAGEIRIPQRKAEATRRAWDAIAAAEDEAARLGPEAEVVLAEGAGALDSGSWTISTGSYDLAQAETDLANSYILLDSRKLELESSLAEIQYTLATLRATESNLLGQRATLRDTLEELQSANENLLDGKRTALGMSSQIGTGLTLLQDGLLELDALLMEIEVRLENLRLLRQELLDRYNASRDRDERDAIMLELEEISAEQKPLYEQRTELLEKQQQAEAQLDEVTAGNEELQAAFKTLRTNRRYWVQKLLQVEAGRHELETGIVTVQDLISTMETQKNELEVGLVELEAMRLELDTTAMALEETRAILARSRQDLRDNQADLMLQQEEVRLQVLAAQATISESRATLLDLKDPKWYVLDRDSNFGYGNFAGEADDISEIGSMLPFLFFLVAALVSLTTITRMVEEQRTSMGTYKALGYSGKRILAKYLLYAIVPSGLGALVGGTLGLMVFPGIIIEGAYGTMYELPAYTAAINPSFLLGGALLATFSTAIPTIITCRGGLKEVPASLMRPKAPKVGKKTPLEYISFLWRRLSFLYKITFRNIFRYKKRLFMTLAGVGGSTALLLTGFGLNDSMSEIVSMQFRTLFQYDMSVTFADDASASSIQSTRKAVAAYPFTKREVLAREEAAKLHTGDGVTTDTTMVVMEPEEIGSFYILKNRLTQEPIVLQKDGAVITEWLAGDMGVGVGSEIVVRDFDDEEFTVTIAAVCEAYVGNRLYLSPDSYEAASGKSYKTNTLHIINNIGTGQEEVDAFMETMLERSGVTAVVSMETNAQTFEDIMGSLAVVILVIILIASILAFVVLFNLTTINLVERTREIATIEVLGFRDKETASYVYRENIIVTALAALIGICLGIPLHAFICQSMEGSGTMLLRDISLLSFVFSFATTMLFTFLVAAMTSGKLKRIDMLGALKSAE